MKKKIIVFSLFLLASLTTFAQDMASLKIEAAKAYKAASNMDYEKIFETTYPKVFDIVPKESMKDMFEQMMENDQFSIQLIEVLPEFTFGDIKKIENKTFCLVDHNNVMEMTFKEPMEDAEMMIDIFKTNMEAKEVSYDKTKNAFTIKLRSTLIAVADDSTNQKWKFLNKDKENKLFSLIFDEKIKTTLGL
ncbi:hypothetical protein ACFS5J_06015 [Flavobacterium chuncheonense]|uniref:DUF4878 domain-containing protein n=1 Tax=Flavobacterium chuncheonense TaxID=2026653 RepID=A0ABW5YLW7_9FLAO